MPQKLLNKFLSNNLIFNSLKIQSKNFLITKEMFDQEILVYTGKIYQMLLIKSNMINHKIGEFIFTRQKTKNKLTLKERSKYRRKKIIKKI